MLCYRCGSKSSEKPFIDSLCIDCYEPKVKSNEASITICSTCGRVRTKEGWYKLTKREIEDLIKRAIKSEGEVVSIDMQKKEAALEIKTTMGKAIKKIPIALKLTKEQCIFCIRKSSGYYTSIIQLRGPLTKVERIKRKFLKEARKYFVKEDEQKTGIDLYFSDTKEIRELIKKFGYPIIASSKLAGRKAGKALYRVTFLIRLE